MATISEIAAYLEERVPSSLKLDYDNVGLLCGFPDKEVTRVLCALDVTGEVIAEAEELGAELILTHHPVIFHPLKRVLATDEVGSKIIGLLQKGISAICLHTNLDAADGGVNDALSVAIGALIRKKLPVGRVVELPQEESMDDFLQRVHTFLRASGIRYYDAGRPVHRIVVCGGAGGDLIEEALSDGADTLLTGEIRYDEWLTGREMGVNLVDADHFCTENVVIPVLVDMLRDGFEGIDVYTSSRHDQTAKGFKHI